MTHPENAALAEALAETALLTELAGENPFKARAFRNAARVIEGLERPAAALLASGELAGMKGIGKGILSAVAEFAEAGAIAAAEALRSAVPPVAFAMLKLPDVGPAKVRALLEHLEIASLNDLEAACLENRLLDLKGFGARTQARILEGLRFLKRHLGRHRLGAALDPGRALVARLRELGSIARVSLTGSLRRRREVVGNVNVLAAAGDPDRAAGEAAARIRAAGAEEVNREASRVHGRLADGLAFEVRLVAPEAFGAALVLTTGAGGHLDALRARARARGLELTPEGLVHHGRTLALDEESAVYAALELPWIPPEIREGRGEIEAAEDGRLPLLLETSDLRGCYHVHSDWSDGRNTLEAIARFGRTLGLGYIGIADHSGSAAYAGGLDAARLGAQADAIDAVNAQGQGAWLLKGVESDILADGRLDYPDPVLARLDFVVGSIHSGLAMDREAATARVVRALEHPRLTMLGHPTGRLLLSREGYALDWERVFRAAAAGRKVIEINAHPARLDLDWRRVREAVAAGVKLAVNPDAHALEELHHLEYGVCMARKGWATAEDVVNTRARPLDW